MHSQLVSVARKTTPMSKKKKKKKKKKKERKLKLSRYVCDTLL